MRPLSRLLATRYNNADHRVTTLELFFDLVFVFAFTQVTAWIAYEHSVLGTVQGLLVLTMMWWVWVWYTWLGNVMRADAGAPLLGFIVTMPAVFVLALTIRHLWEAPGGALAPLAFFAAYIVIRTVNAVVYAWGARSDAKLLRQVLINGVGWIPAGALILVGALADPEARLWWWAGALALDLGAQWVTAKILAGWVLPAPGHLAERFGLIVILALGESVVAVGVAAEGIDLSAELIATAILGVLVAVGLWWIYFKNVGPALEARLEASDAKDQMRLARDSYTYLHLPVVAGIIIAAAGIEEAVFAIADTDSAGASATLLTSGVALVCVAGALLLAQAGATWRWFAVAGAAFAGAAFWMPSWNALLAIGVTAAALAIVGVVTPRTRVVHEPDIV